MEMAADRTGGMACVLQAAMRGNVAFAAYLEISPVSLTGIRNRRLRPRLELRRMRRVPGKKYRVTWPSETMPGSSRTCAGGVRWIQ